jgi:hypothetical protein
LIVGAYNRGLPCSKIQNTKKKVKMEREKIKLVSLLGKFMGQLLHLDIYDHDEFLRFERWLRFAVLGFIFLQTNYVVVNLF